MYKYMRHSDMFRNLSSLSDQYHTLTVLNTDKRSCRDFLKDVLNVLPFSCREQFWFLVKSLLTSINSQNMQVLNCYSNKVAFMFVKRKKILFHLDMPTLQTPTLNATRDRYTYKGNFKDFVFVFHLKQYLPYFPFEDVVLRS